MDADGGLAAQGTLELAYATADAERLNDGWALEQDGLSAGARRLDLLQVDRLVRYRACFLADDARDAVCPRQATIAVDGGEADAGVLLLLERQVGDGAGGSGLARRLQ